MSETTVITLPMVEADILQTTSKDRADDIETPPTMDQNSAASTPERQVLTTFDIRPPSHKSGIREVHSNGGLQPYQILRRTLRPGRPLMTISALPSGQIVAGTKAGRRECHVFVGDPELGATLWLPVVRSRSRRAWTFDAADKNLTWQELVRRDGLELVDNATAEVLACCCEASGGGVALQLFCDMEQPLVLLVMASMMAVLESSRAQDAKDSGRKTPSSCVASSPGTSRAPSSGSSSHESVERAEGGSRR